MNLYVWTQLEKDVIVENLLLAKTGDSQAMQKATTLLLPFAEEIAITQDIIHEYVLIQLFCYPTILSKACAVSSDKKIDGTLREFARADLAQIEEHLLNVDWNAVAQKCQVISLDNYSRSFIPDKSMSAYNQSIISMLQTKSNDQLLDNICQHIYKFGIGEMARFRAFKWQEDVLHSVKEVDTVNMDDLIGIDYQKEVLIENTRYFLQGKPANHVLLCGTMGSGKSSIIKALLSYFEDESLYLVEIDKQDIPSLGQLLEIVGENPQCKYIFFLDDLTFEGDDKNYSLLKTALDGQLLKSNKNVLYYATSNRRNLVRDNWAERTGDVHENDTMNEQYSLSERFGIKLYFAAYDQNEYLRIVQSRIETAGLSMTDEIKKEALIWERMYHGRSGRTATNFVKNYLSKIDNET